MCVPPIAEAFKFHSPTCVKLAMTRARRDSTKQTPWEVNHNLHLRICSRSITVPSHRRLRLQTGLRPGIHKFSKNLEATSKTQRARRVTWSTFHTWPTNDTRHCKRKFSRHGDLEPEICAPVPDCNNECTVASLTCELHTPPNSLPLNLINLIMPQGKYSLWNSIHNFLQNLYINHDSHLNTDV